MIYSNEKTFLLHFAIPHSRQLKKEDIIGSGNSGEPKPSKAILAQMLKNRHSDSVHHLIWTPGSHSALIIEKEYYPFEPHHFALVPALVPHSEYRPKSKRQMVWLLTHNDRATLISEGTAVWAKEFPKSAAINQRVEQLLNDVRTKDDNWFRHFRNELENLLIDLTRYLEAQPATPSRGWYASVCTAMENYIESHLQDRSMTIEQVARSVRLCQSYASTVYKRQTGRTLLEFVHKAKIRAAKKLLLDAQLNVNEVANRLGFSSTRHFRRLFRKATGFSPREYRRR